jgi:hypothetical protein
MRINEIDPAIEALDQAIASHPFRPKGIRVGIELFKSLKSAGRIKSQSMYFEGVIASGETRPVLDDDIFVVMDSGLGDCEYRLPEKG